MPHAIDERFLARPLRALADAALQRASDLGASHADVRIEQTRSQGVRLRDARLEGSHEGEDLGMNVRVVVDGSWGFAAGERLTTQEAVRLAGEAVEVARVSAAMNTERVELADEPVYRDGVWVSAYDIDPFGVPEADKVALLADYSQRLLDAPGVAHVTAGVAVAKEVKYYADTAGTTTTQQRVRTNPSFEALALNDDGFETMGSLASPAGRGWEYLTGTGYDFAAELAEIPSLLAEKMAAPSVEAGRYDLVIDPSNLWLTIHESIGHATELDRALGYEANYAGTSFATPDKFGSLRYGTEAMTVTGDRTVDHGLATVGWDDEGVATQRWDIVRAGRLVGYQLDRRMAALLGDRLGVARSNGCAYADSPGHIPIQRMANVSLAAAATDVTTSDLIGGVERGIYVLGDKSWSIDMQRLNFQFTGQRFFAIRDGRLAGQLRDVAYQGNTLGFWGSLEAVGGPSTWVLGGAFNCGKAEPGQIAPVSHGCPSTLFRGIDVLNTVTEGGR